MNTITAHTSTRGGPERLAPPDPARRTGPPAGSVRPARSEQDWRAAARLLRDHLAWIEEAGGINVAEAQPAIVAELDDLARAYSTPGATLLVAEDTDGSCGTVAIKLDRGRAELKRMFVRPTARGRGHAGRLIRAAIAHARSVGATEVWLETLPGLMDTAIGLYRRHGFVEVPTSPLVDVDDAIVMTLDLGKRAAA